MESREIDNPLTHPKHDCNDYHTKVYFNSKKYTGCKCMICDTILEFEWKSEHSLSLPPSNPDSYREAVDINFVVWYSGMKEEQVKKALERYKREVIYKQSKTK